jgi:transposase
MAQNRSSSDFREQIIKECLEVDSIVAVCNKHGLNAKTVSTWVRNYKNRDEIQDQKQVRQLQKKLIDAELEIKVLKSLLKKTYQVWNNEEKP